MQLRFVRLGLSLSATCLTTLLAPLAALAFDGLATPAPGGLWPQLQARIALQAASVSPLSTSSLLAPTAAQRGVQGGAIFGDYYFATPSFGSFRASGGLMTGLQSGLPVSSARPATRLGVALSTGPALPMYPGAGGTDTPGTVPYLGLGFSGGAWRHSLSISADVGMVAERPGAAGGVGRAIFGNEAFDGALRELRLSPVLQLGVRYTF